MHDMIRLIREESNMQKKIDLSQDGSLQLDPAIEEGSVWLSQAEIAELFGKDRRTITRYIQNMYKPGAGNEDQMRSVFEHTANDGKTYKVQYYNLDMILSVGYRVNSQKGIAFRKWANSILKDYIVKGCAHNRK